MITPGQDTKTSLLNVGGSTKRRDSLAPIRMAMQERMGAKRQLEVDMYQALTGASRTLQVTHFTKEFILATHTMDVGGLEIPYLSHCLPIAAGR